MNIFSLILFVVSQIVSTSITAEDSKYADIKSEKHDHRLNNELDETQGEPTVRVEVRIDNIRKSEQDERSYRGLVLSNGLRVLLISDPQTGTAAASLSVNVGSMHDPEEIPGLAHLLEHMLFMGSEKYPEKDYLKAFVEDHAGMRNGTTSEARQQYYFNVSSANLAESLDIMAHMFINPKLTPSAVEREVNTVDSEMRMHFMDDDMILDELERSLSEPGHSHAKFRCGNKESLQTNPESKGIDVHAKLCDLFRERFSSNMMNLVVLGKESLENLETMVVPVYGKIENKNILRSLYRKHPWGREQLNREVRFIPRNDMNTLKIVFPLPDPWESYKYAPAGYVRYLLGQNRAGCLSGALAGRNWIHEFGTNCWATPGFGFFAFTLRLTEEGLYHVNEIVKFFFQYIYFLKTGGIQKSSFDKLEEFCESAFQCQNRGNPLDDVIEICSSMQVGFSFEDLLSKEVPGEWNPSIIEGLLDFLVPENMNILIGSKSFENDVDLVEQWYGTKYSVERISDDLINGMWKITQPYDQFYLPPPSEFTSENVDLDPPELDRSEFPRIIHVSEISQFWFQRDYEFKVPKFYIRVNIFTPAVGSSVKSRELSEILISLFTEMLMIRVDGYVLELEGLTWKMLTTSRGFRVTLSGYTEKLLKFTKIFFNELINFGVVEQKFEISKQSVIRNHKNFNTEQPYRQVYSYLYDLLCEPTLTKAGSSDIQKYLLVADMRKFKERLFSRVFLHGLIYGNCDERLAKEVVSTIEKAFPAKSVVLTREIIPARVIELGEGTNFILEAQHEHSAESAYLGYFQVGPNQPLRNAVLTNLFTQIVVEKCHKTFRVDERLGYIVECVWRETGDIMAFVVVVQSNMHPVYVNARVEIFLRQLHRNLIEMSSKEFEANKSSLRDTYLKKQASQEEKLEKLWEEFPSRSYYFESDKEKAELLDILKKEDIIEFFETYIAESSSQRRKLEFHVISKISNPPLPVDEPIEKSDKIEDRAIFTSGLAFYSNMVSHREITPLGISESRPVCARKPVSPKEPEMDFCRRAFNPVSSFIFKNKCVIL